MGLPPHPPVQDNCLPLTYPRAFFIDAFELLLLNPHIPQGGKVQSDPLANREVKSLRKSDLAAGKQENSWDPKES